MSSNTTLLGNGFVPNLLRLTFFIVGVMFFFGPMQQLMGTEYQWLSFLIGGLLAASVISVLFFKWKVSLPMVLAFLAANLAGFSVMGGNTHLIGARQAYVEAAVNDIGQEAAYIKLMPNELQTWVRQFQPGSGTANAHVDGPLKGDEMRFLSEPSTPKSGFEAARLVYLSTPNLDMDDEQFVSSYQALALEHGDWLGFFARCVHSKYKTTPLIMPGAKEAAERAKRSGVNLCQRPEAAFGIDLDAAAARYLQDRGLSKCTNENLDCRMIRQDLRHYRNALFPI